MIVATDADDDGMHIRLLMLTFFLKFFPDLVKKGHVFVLQTPLFRVRARRTKVGKAKMNGIEAELAAREKGAEEADAYSDGKRPRHITLSKDFVTQYCYTEDERQQAIDDLGPEPEITRFKGLGEISPDEFRNFIGPDIRLDQVLLHGRQHHGTPELHHRQPHHRGRQSRRGDWHRTIMTA